MDDIKDVAKAIIEPILSFAVKNSKEEEKDDVKNEDVDKRDIIRQIMAIAGKEEASEDVKTIAKLAEKLAYDKSEDGTADNKKAKNEEDEEKEEAFEEEKEVANKKAKNEDEEDKKEKVEDEDDEDKEEAENKCKNSMDDIKNAIFGGKSDIKTGYMSKAQRLELGNKY